MQNLYQLSSQQYYQTLIEPNLLISQGLQVLVDERRVRFYELLVLPQKARVFARLPPHDGNQPRHFELPYFVDRRSLLCVFVLIRVMRGLWLKLNKVSWLSLKSTVFSLVTSCNLLIMNPISNSFFTCSLICSGALHRFLDQEALIIHY